MAALGPKDLIIVLVMLLVIFGSKRLPEMGRSLGHGMREFKDGLLGKVRAREEIPAAPVLPRSAEERGDDS